MKDYSFWRGRRVFLTGHTGFMGGWLAIFLTRAGALVTGYALVPQTNPSFYAATGLEARLHRSVIADIRDGQRIKDEMAAADPEVVFHLAAQAIVSAAQVDPVHTYDVNVMGTIKVLEAARGCQALRSVVVVTTDKVYKNNAWAWPYREIDELGGKEPYSSSKACADILLDAYRNVYLHSFNPGPAAVGLASIRAGNIIGGGDWAQNRLVPDAVRGFVAGKPLVLRNPASTRPWQHVLDPFPGYLELAERLAADPAKYSSGWNFGPALEDCREVGVIAGHLCREWGGAARFEVELAAKFYEERLLTLDCSKARLELDWHPSWPVETAVARTIEWYRAFYEKADMWPMAQKHCAEIAGS